MTLLHITYDKVRVTFNVKHFGISQSASASASQSVPNALSVDFGFLLSEQDSDESALIIQRIRAGNGKAEVVPCQVDVELRDPALKVIGTWQLTDVLLDTLNRSDNGAAISFDVCMKTMTDTYTPNG